jgi:hypothetical protein
MSALPSPSPADAPSPQPPHAHDPPPALPAPQGLPLFYSQPDDADPFRPRPHPLCHSSSAAHLALFPSSPPPPWAAHGALPIQPPLPPSLPPGARGFELSGGGLPSPSPFPCAAHFASGGGGGERGALTASASEPALWPHHNLSGGGGGGGGGGGYLSSLSATPATSFAGAWPAGFEPSSGGDVMAGAGGGGGGLGLQFGSGRRGAGGDGGMGLAGGSPSGGGGGGGASWQLDSLAGRLRQVTCDQQVGRRGLLGWARSAEVACGTCGMVTLGVCERGWPLQWPLRCTRHGWTHHVCIGLRLGGVVTDLSSR